MAIRKTKTKYSGISITRKGLMALRHAVFISYPNKRSIPKEQLINIVNIAIAIKIIFIPYHLFIYDSSFFVRTLLVLYRNRGIPFQYWWKIIKKQERFSDDVPIFPIQKSKKIKNAEELCST
jgi:hypothetical protein